MKLKYWSLTIFLSSLLLSILFYYQTTDFVLKEYSVRSCPGIPLNLVRQSCGDYSTQLTYANNVLRFSIPTTVVAGILFLLQSIFGFITK